MKEYLKTRQKTKANEQEEMGMKGVKDSNMKNGVINRSELLSIEQDKPPLLSKMNMKC